MPPGRNLHAHLTDITPTILAALGVSIPAHIEGTPILGSAKAPEPTGGFNLVRHDPAEALDGPHRRPFEYSSEEQQIIEQRLVDLGYLE
jgi:arylsulfatase A-like enzyme